MSEPERREVVVFVAVGRVEGRAHRRAPCAPVRVRDRVREARRVVARPAAEPEARLARVVVPGGNRADRDDRGKPVGARRGGGVGQRPVVGLADHPRLAVVPARQDGVPVLVVRGPTAVEPVDREHGAAVVGCAAGDGAAGGEPGADHVQQHHRVPTRDEVVVVEQRPAIVEPVAVDIGDALALVPTAQRGVIRARVHDHRGLQAGRACGGPDDVQGDLVGYAVEVAVEVRGDPQPLADRVRVPEGGLRHAARDDRRCLRLRNTRRHDRHREHRRGRSHETPEPAWLHVSPSMKRQNDLLFVSNLAGQFRLPDGQSIAAGCATVCPPAPVAQWIEQRFPKPRAQVRFLPGALPLPSRAGGRVASSRCDAC